MSTMTVTTTRISSDEFLAGDYPIGSELIDGVVHADDPGSRHQRLCKRVHRALDHWAEAEPGRGEAGWGGNWVLSASHLDKPDVWWTATPPEGSRHDGPPEVGPGEEPTSPLLPGFTLPIDALFAD